MPEFPAEAKPTSLLPPVPPTRRPSPSPAEAPEPLPVSLWMRIRLAVGIVWVFASNRPTCFIAVGRLLLGSGPASSTNPLAISSREPSILQTVTRILQQATTSYGSSSTARSSPNPKNTLSSSACLRLGLFSFAATSKRNAKPPLHSRRQWFAARMNSKV